VTRDDDVEALQVVYSEWARGNFWTPEIFDPSIELVWAAEMPDLQGGEYRGLAGVERGMREWLEVWDDCRWEAEEFLVAGDQILVPFIARGRGKGSDLEVEARWAHLWTMRDGRAIKLVGYADRAVALAAFSG
jgi:ketosteroid isomerase-like protein